MIRGRRGGGRCSARARSGGEPEDERPHHRRRFGDSRADAAAKAKLQSLFPGRVVEQLNIDYIGLGGGGIHCVTQPQPVP
ncbi:agmatine deiminase family protein [Kitasatospora sp. NPDC001603]|uniref:agmatine deiminase family protein n=1 Tax=Kitasatospora sp. NPDC001603 TaxID=3154388 RepID=UPI00333183D7